MSLVGTTFLLAVAMAINHAVHGVGCWGLQAGGPTSQMIYGLQILCAASGLVWLLVKIAQREAPLDVPGLMALAALVTASVAGYRVVGWRIFTSIHAQGLENLIAYLSVAGMTCVIGWYPHAKGDVRDAASVDESGEPPVGKAAGAGTPSDNPYEPPRNPA